MRIIIQVTTGDHAGRSFLLSPGEAVNVGRTEWADFCVPYDELMSGRHFAVQCQGETVRLVDLDSTNGTLLNGERVTSSPLSDGDQIVAGRTTFRVEIEAAQTPPLPSAVAPIPEAVPTRSVTTPPHVAIPISPAATVVSVPAESYHSPTRVAVNRQPAHITPALLQQGEMRRPFADALADPDEAVRNESLMAAVWSRQPWLLEHCRAMAARPGPLTMRAHWLLAVLGQATDLERVLALGRIRELGPARYSILASFGHPRVVHDLLIALESKDPAEAVAAGKSFTTITGAEIDSRRRVTMTPVDGHEPDAFEREFQPTEFLPDARTARQHWDGVKDEFSKGLRWRRGLEVSRPFETGVVDHLDLEGRWEAHLRGRYEGQWNGRLAHLTRFRPSVWETAAAPRTSPAG